MILGTTAVVKTATAAISNVLFSNIESVFGCQNGTQLCTEPLGDAFDGNCEGGDTGKMKDALLTITLTNAVALKTLYVSKRERPGTDDLEDMKNYIIRVGSDASNMFDCGGSYYDGGFKSCAVADVPLVKVI